MKKITIFIGLALLLILCATPVYAIPALPHSFYGSVTINGSLAPIGTSVEARATGVRTGIAGNPITVTEAGKYGGPDGLDPKLAVQGDILSGATITFYVNGVSTDQTDTFVAGGGPTQLGLSVTIAPAAPSGNGDVGPSTYYGETTFFGIEGRLLIDSEGKILRTIEATSADGKITITIPKGTIALDKHGNPLSSLTADIDPSPPDPPEDANIIGLAYDFGPEGATFDPAITIEYTYDPGEVPEGVAEEDLVIAFYDEDIGEWVECTCECDPGTHCVTAAVSHFTCFAIIAPAPAPPPVPAPVPVPVPAPPPPAPPPPAPPPPVIIAPPAPPPAPPAPLPPAPAAPAPPAPAPPNWPLFGGLIAAVVVAGLIIYFLVVRRRAY